MKSAKRFLMIVSVLVAAVSLVGCGRASTVKMIRLVDRSLLQFLPGTWSVTYTNGAKRTYTIERDGGVAFEEEQILGEFVGGDYLLLEFDDGKLERLTPAGSRLLVEHFNPRNRFPNHPPTHIGIGVRVERSVQVFAERSDPSRTRP